MEDSENVTVSIGSIGDVQSHWWWALSTAAQLTWAISASRRDCHYRLVPYKALGVATLFVSAGASAAISTLHACGIRTVKDIQELSQKTKGIITVRQTVNDESESESV
ncbi:hypothetical protein QQ045_014977 [Rhodiola kirilowii]